MSKKQANKRSRIFVEARIQGALLLRVCLYWVCCLVTAMGVVFVWSTAEGPPEPLALKLEALWSQFLPGVIVTIAVLPLAIHDIIKVSNRFVGPIVRLRSALQQVARGEPVEPIRFRKGDFWQDLTGAFNECLPRLQRSPTGSEASPEGLRFTESQPAESSEPVSVG